MWNFDFFFFSTSNAIKKTDSHEKAKRTALFVIYDGRSQPREARQAVDVLFW